MKLLRQIIFWCHLAAGVFAGVVILIMSVTGVLLTYERQMIEWADTRGYAPGPPQDGATPLPAEALIAKAREARPAERPTTLTLRSDAAAPAQVGFGREGVLYLNRYTGEILGGGSPRTRAFFHAVTDWHRRLGAHGESRAWGRAVTGACNLAFLFLVGSGFYLWWPRKWTRASLRGVTWFKRGLGGRARDFNWHNAVGFWSAVPLFVVVLSAVVISYTWASNLVYRVAGEEPPAPRQQQPPQQQQQGVERRGPQPELAVEGLNVLWARAAEQQADWRSISLRLPTAADKTAVFNIDGGTGGQPQRRAQLTLDRQTGEVAKWEPFSSYTLGRRLRSYLRFAHTGEVFGLAGQTVAGLASAGGALLVWTGLALAWRRFGAWARRRRARMPEVAAGAGAELAAARRAE
jgi:uncharacterized iron-regulated membrane protein